MKASIALAALASCALALPALAQQAPPKAPAPKPAPAPRSKTKARLFLGGGYFPGSTSFSQTRTFKEFAEDGTITGGFKRKKGPGFEGGLQYDITPNVGTAVTFAVSNRESDVSFDAALPHPFFLNQPRKVSGTAALPFSEKAVHSDVVYTGSSGSLDLSVFGGPSVFFVDADIADTVSYAHAYPFDTVTVNGLNSLSAKKTAFGFNAGAGADYRFSPSVGFGVRARFSQATAKVSSTGSSASVKAGGFQVGGGLTVRF